MERKITHVLQQWAAGTLPGSPRNGHMPLVLTGARQVGKTYAALEFGKTHFANTVYVNVDGSRQIEQIFARDFDPTRIIKDLAAWSGQTILEDQTLIILDEIQANERAIAALKYFTETNSPYRIIATGSLLGVSINRHKESFPVGKIHLQPMHPMDFEEFLWALGRRDLADDIRQASLERTSFPLHDTALDLHRRYLAVGGMPQAVAEFQARSDDNYVRAVQQNLDMTFVADMAKYTNPTEAARIMAAWSAVPAQLASDQRRFRYKTIRPGARAKDYATALDWLAASALVNRCHRVTTGRLPLAAHSEPDIFKLYLVDTGLLGAKLDIPPTVIANTPARLSGFAGAFTENHLAQALTAANIPLYYWESPGQAEIDFVTQNATGDIIPIEVKASHNVRSKSLTRFRELYHPPAAIRLSTRPIAQSGDLLSLPHYAAFTLPAELGRQ
jgi:predicted AAA+ superfamily ATPase